MTVMTHKYTRLITSSISFPLLPPHTCTRAPPLHTHTHTQYDCPKSHRQITPEEVEAFVKDNGFIKHFETSVKDGTNINEALE